MCLKEQCGEKNVPTLLSYFLQIENMFLMDCIMIVYHSRSLQLSHYYLHTVIQTFPSLVMLTHLVVCFYRFNHYQSHLSHTCAPILHPLCRFSEPDKHIPALALGQHIQLLLNQTNGCCCAICLKIRLVI